MQTVKFSVACNAIYHGELQVNGTTKEEILHEIWDKLPEVPVNNLEWLSDYEDPSQAVTIDDIIELGGK